jgi:hypothetical protein
MAHNEPIAFSYFPRVTYISIICAVITNDQDDVNRKVYRFHNIGDTVRKQYMGNVEKKCN